MNNNAPTSTAPSAQEEARESRLAYEAPELTIYNQSAITMGGAKSVAADFVPGGGTSYKS